MIEQAAMEDGRTFLLFQLLKAHYACVPGKRKATSGACLMTTVHLRQTRGTC